MRLMRLETCFQRTLVYNYDEGVGNSTAVNNVATSAGVEALQQPLPAGLCDVYGSPE
jgi:hypothetical protein